jgi:Nuclease-related domain
MTMTLREQIIEKLRDTGPVPAQPQAPDEDVSGTTYGMVRECLRLQATARPRSVLARLLGSSPLQPEARAWYEGALGELAVQKELEKLGAEWTLLSAVPIGAHAGDIHHIVLGPGGIFTISVKNVADAAVWAGGRKTVVDDRPADFIRRAQSEGASAARSLSNAAGGPVQITPLLVLNRPAKLTLREPAVAVVTVKGLAAWLQRQRRVHSPEAVAYYAMVAGEPETWNLEAGAAQETLRDLQRFERLRREVEAAAVRRRALRIASGTALLATLLEGVTAAVSQARVRRPAAALTTR